MHDFAILSIGASIVCFTLGLFVYFLDRKALLNKIFMLGTFAALYWSFTEFMMWQAENATTAYLWNKAGFLWPFFTVLVVHFAMIYTESKFAKNKLTLAGLYLPALAFSLIDLTTDEISGFPVQEYWGYVYTSPTTLLCILSSIWSAGLAFMALYVFVKYYRRIAEKNKRQQARYLVLGFSISVFAYAITNIVFPLSDIKFPNVGFISVGVFSCFVAYAIWRYELFSLNPAVAAEYIVSTMPDSLILANLDGKILRVSSSLVHFLGYNQNEINDKPITDLFLNNQYGLTAFSLLLEKRIIRNHETKCKTSSGEEKIVLFSGSIVQSKRGQDIGVACFLHDITDRKLMEEKLVKAERFASIGELAGMVGHDLRNPLTSIRTATYYLKKKHATTMDSSEKEMFWAIEKSISYSDKIVTDLLDYSREIKLDLEQTTPKRLLTSILCLVEVPPNVKVHDMSEDVPKMMVDAGKMSRVFINIMKNSFDAMPNGGKLTIRSKKTGNHLEVAFADTGVGMSQETLSKLWVPLFTTKSKGMGFGLSICKRVVEAHGGKISAESTIGNGTIITITIPIDLQPVPQAN